MRAVQSAILFALAALAARPALSEAARVAFQPVIQQFEAGGGVVTTRVARIDQDAARNFIEPVASVTFTVESIDAEPLGGEFALKPGDSITLLAGGTGYKVGDLRQLFIKYNSGNKHYESSQGGYSVQLNGRFISRETLGRLRELAGMVPERRVIACRAIAADGKENELLRLEAITELESRDRFNSKENIAEAAETLLVLRKVWEEASPDMSDRLGQELDWALRNMDPAFAVSPMRAQFWMAKAFRPIAAASPEERQVRTIAQGEIVRNILRDPALANVAGVRDKLLEEAGDGNLPLYIRARVGGLLEGIWLMDKNPDDRYLAAAENIYLQALSSDDNEIVIIAADQILSGLRLDIPFESAPRHYTPGVDIRRAAKSALPEMQAREEKFAESKDAYHRGRTALTVDVLREVIAYF